ncbi:MAG: type II toxin-antitoxin system VapC family toxin [Sideroxydans sp.]|nr:type II toxin-antitoxin system VapC family toxin [Sideroxydans sp.]
MLVDSNILIYATKPEYGGLRQWLVDTLPKVSVISKVEILGYHKLHPAEKIALTELLGSLELIYPTNASYEIAIQLRQQHKLSLGDALIAATCLERGLSLATCNVGDFSWIDGLKILNPLEVS